MKLLAAVWKELLLLLRDRGGVAILFVMPTAMVLIATLVQEDALRAIRGGRTSVLVAVAKDDSFGDAVADGARRLGLLRGGARAGRPSGDRGDDPRGAARRDAHHRDRGAGRGGREGRRRRRPAPRPDDAGGAGSGSSRRRRAAGGDRGVLRPGGPRPVPPRGRQRAGAALPGRRGPDHDGQDRGDHERRRRQAVRGAPPGRPNRTSRSARSSRGRAARTPCPARCSRTSRPGRCSRCS